MTLQQHFNLITEGKGNKAQFLKQARLLFPEYFNQYTDFNTATNVLKSKQIISEAAGGVVAKGYSVYDWKKILGEEIKATEKETSKEVADANKNAFQPSDMKNADNVNFNEIMKGFFAEMYDEKNKKKTGDEIKAMVVKNLAKDALYYTKNGNFSTMGVGYTTEAPGLGEPKAPKGKHKASGYGDIEKEVKVKANVQDSLGNKEAKDSMPKKVKEMSVTPQNSAGVKKMKMPGAEKKMKLQEGESKLRSVIRNLIKEEINEYGMDSGGQDMTYGMYNRSITKKGQGNKDFIDKGKYDYYEDISFNNPPYDFGKNKYYGGADLAKLWQLGWKQAEAEDKGIEMEDNDFEPRRDDSDDQSSDFYDVNL